MEGSGAVEAAGQWGNGRRVSQSGKRPRMGTHDPFGLAPDEDNRASGAHLVAAPCTPPPRWRWQHQSVTSTPPSAAAAAAAEESSHAWFTPRRRTTARLGDSGMAAAPEPVGVDDASSELREARAGQMERYHRFKAAEMFASEPPARHRGGAARSVVFGGAAGAAAVCPSTSNGGHPEPLQPLRHWNKRDASDAMSDDGTDVHEVHMPAERRMRRRMEPDGCPPTSPRPMRMAGDPDEASQPMLRMPRDGHEEAPNDRGDLTVLLNQLHHERMLRSPRGRSNHQ